jgi:hypothetical protein
MNKYFAEIGRLICLGLLQPFDESTKDVFCS